MSDNLLSVIDELKSLRMDLPIKQYLPTEEVIDEYEAAIGLKFSEDYRVFLKNASDSMYNGKDALRITPERNHPKELEVYLQHAREAGMPSDLLPICEDNGNYFCISPDQKIIYWDHDGVSDETWDDLATWIKDVWIDGN